MADVGPIKDSPRALTAAKHKSRADRDWILVMRRFGNLAFKGIGGVMNVDALLGAERVVFMGCKRCRPSLWAPAWLTANCLGWQGFCGEVKENLRDFPAFVRL